MFQWNNVSDKLNVCVSLFSVEHQQWEITDHACIFSMFLIITGFFFHFFLERFILYRLVLVLLIWTLSLTNWFVSSMHIRHPCYTEVSLNLFAHLLIMSLCMEYLMGKFNQMLSLIYLAGDCGTNVFLRILDG